MLKTNHIDPKRPPIYYGEKTATRVSSNDRPPFGGCVANEDGRLKRNQGNMN